MGQGWLPSLALHGMILAIALMGLPSFLQREQVIDTSAMVVELVPVGERTNIKPPPPTETPKPKPERPKPKLQPKPPKPKEPTLPKPEPVAQKELAPPPPKETPKPTPEPAEAKPEKPKETKPEPKPEPKQAQPSFDDILKDLADEAKDREPQLADRSAANTPSRSQYNPSMPLSVSQVDAIRRQIQRCWRIPAGVRDAHELVINLRLMLAQDGSVRRVEVMDRLRYGTDRTYRAAADSAVRAVKMCSPLKELPANRYASWREMELTFNPRDVLY